MSNVEQHVELEVDGSGDDIERVPIFSQLTVLAVMLLLLLGAGVTPKIIAALQPQAVESVVAETLAPLTPQTPDLNAFAPLNLQAESVFVWDITEQRVLHQVAADKQLPLASITKLMTALVANELLTGTTTITVSERAINQDGASGLLADEQFTLLNLSDLMLLTSSNDGAYAVAETLGREFDANDPAEAFVALMNIRAEELGLGQTYFRNPTGLDIAEDEAGAYGSARDIAFLMEYILESQPTIIESTADPAHTVISQNGIVHSARNTNQNVVSVPGIIGSKTGYTELAGGNLVVAFDAGVNRPVVVVALGSTWQGRFEDVNRLVAATIDALQ
ncbi:hypothetical protein CL655_01810 [bacterium]|nr:hypothetical protein [bacterium]